jgi:hypothetical protein
MLLTLAVVALPAAAKSKGPVGDRMVLVIGTPATWPASTPFYIEHGWGISLSQDAVGKFSFDLSIDGVSLQADYVTKTTSPGAVFKSWGYNFPAGLSGSHVITGAWVGPCQVLVDNGSISGPCSTPNAVVEWFSRSGEVDFE